jgi:thioredoxin reductase
VRDRQLGVLGWTPESVHYAQIVRQWTDDLAYFTPPDTLTPAQRSELEARAIAVVEGTVTQVVVEDDRLRGVRLDDGRFVTREFLFVPPRLVPHNELLVGLGCAVDDDGWPVKDAHGRTSVPGVWVAGNVANPRAQVVTAAGEGSASAIAINADLVDDDVRIAASGFAQAT